MCSSDSVCVDTACGEGVFAAAKVFAAEKVYVTAVVRICVTDCAAMTLCVTVTRASNCDQTMCDCNQTATATTLCDHDPMVLRDNLGCVRA